jgi:hypothetical protein
MSFVQVTIAGNKQKVYIRADQIMAVDKSPKNDLETVLITSIMSTNGPIMYSVLDAGEPLAKAIIAAMKTGELQVPGPRIQ